MEQGLDQDRFSIGYSLRANPSEIQFSLGQKSSELHTSLNHSHKTKMQTVS